MSRKRKRELDEFDEELINIWANLADEHEEQRLNAAESLISRCLDSRYISRERLETVLRRLFRGLCSGRKSARLGFSIALTELLSQLNSREFIGSPDAPPSSEVVDIFEKETSLRNSSGGQEDRDHYFGIVFGAECLIKSKFVLREDSGNQLWGRVVEKLCVTALKKPWLRQECGWLLFQSIDALSNDESAEELCRLLVDQMVANAVIRTPEGVAVWLEIQAKVPQTSLPKKIWHHREPLHKKELDALAEIMKNAKVEQNESTDIPTSQGSGMWQSNLHFAWERLLLSLFEEESAAGNRASFENFWQKVVDESLFSPESSKERKHWGLLVLGKAFLEAPPDQFDFLFTTNAIRTLRIALSSQEKSLERSARRTVHDLQQRLDRDDSVKVRCLRSLLYIDGWSDFDSLTQSKVVEKCLQHSEKSMEQVDFLGELLEQLHGSHLDGIGKKALAAAKLFETMFNQYMLHLTSNLPGHGTKIILETLVAKLMREVCFNYAEEEQSSQQEKARLILRDKLLALIDKALRQGSLGNSFLYLMAAHLHRWDAYLLERGQISPKFDSDVSKVVSSAWEEFDSLDSSVAAEGTDEESNAKRLMTEKGLLILFSICLLQAYIGEPEAVEILADLIRRRDDVNVQPNGSEPAHTLPKADSLLELLLSFASQPSRLMRSISAQVFEAISPAIDTLEPLFAILRVEENIHGQADIFDSVPQEDEEESADEDLDSDVEMITATSMENGVDSPGESESEPDDATDDEEPTAPTVESEDEELLEFEKKLAAALGTRKLVAEDLDDDASSSSSDSSLDSDGMADLDSKLSDVFRARQAQVGANKSKTQEKQSARENITNFKNRVLDLIETYIRAQHANPLSLTLLIPLLILARTTRAKQLSERACNLIRDLCRRCKGSQNRPAESIDDTMSLVEEVHAQALLSIRDLSSSQVPLQRWSSTCSSASLLLVNIAVKTTTKPKEKFEILDRLIGIYGDTRKVQLSAEESSIQPSFFTDWNNWCAQYAAELRKGQDHTAQEKTKATKKNNNKKKKKVNGNVVS